MFSFLSANNKKLRLILNGTVFAYSLLIALFAYLCISDDKHSWQLLIFQSLPLLLLVPGIIRRHYRAYSWMCFIILAYFTVYSVEVVAPTGDVYDWLALILSIVIFCGAMMTSRGLQRENQE